MRYCRHLSPPSPPSAQGRAIGRFSDAGRYPPHDAQRRAVPAAAGKLAAAARPAAGRASWHAVWSWAAVNVLQVHLLERPGNAHACPLPPDYP